MLAQETERDRDKRGTFVVPALLAGLVVFLVWTAASELSPSVRTQKVSPAATAPAKKKRHVPAPVKARVAEARLAPLPELPALPEIEVEDDLEIPAAEPATSTSTEEEDAVEALQLLELADSLFSNEPQGD